MTIDNGTAIVLASVCRPSHDHVKIPSRGITAQLVECRPLVAAFAAADAVVPVDFDDFTAHAAGDLGG
jgi:hypothetical protein